MRLCAHAPSTHAHTHICRTYLSSDSNTHTRLTIHKVKELTKGMNRCVRESKKAREASEKAQQATQVAVKARDKAKREKDRALKLCDELRGYRKLYQDMAAEYPKIQVQRNKALRQVEELTERAKAAEELTRESSKRMQIIRQREKTCTHGGEGKHAA